MRNIPPRKEISLFYTGLCEVKGFAYYLLAHHLEFVDVSNGKDAFYNMTTRLSRDVENFFPVNTGMCWYRTT